MIDIKKLNAKDILDILRKMYWIGNEDEAKIILESMYIFDEKTLEDFLSGESKVVCGDGMLEIEEGKDVDFIAEMIMEGIYIEDATVKIKGIDVSSALFEYYLDYSYIRENSEKGSDEWVDAIHKIKNARRAITEIAGWNISNYDDKYYEFIDELKRLADGHANFEIN